MNYSMTFDSFFHSATGNPKPYPYQRRFAMGETLPQLLSIPTGVGKTATAVLGWLWRRRFADAETKANTPRRLVYCLPMRTLAEQTRDECLRWLDRLHLLAGDVAYLNDDPTQRIESFSIDIDADPQGGKIGVHVLMGGEETDDWDIYPERDAILIGTQDMLLSRALNRGYGMSRYRWPMHFGLLNNDCLWILDEVQLMDVGAATSAQLEAFRRNLGTSSSVHCVWMSATLDPSWLDTVDFDTQWLGQPLELQGEDRQLESVRVRREAVKPIERARATLVRPKVEAEAHAAAEAVLEAHQPASLTLAVFNTVNRAVAVYEAIKSWQSITEPTALAAGAEDDDVESLRPEASAYGSQKTPNLSAHPDCVLIHSRFRPPEREKKMRQLLTDPPAEGTIAITTQVVEAGVDVSAKTLLTDLAPWASLVQRFGRCNRRGEFNQSHDARVIWFDWMSREQFKTEYVKEVKEKGKKPPKEEEIDQKYSDYLDGIARPYSVDELRWARDHHDKLDNVGPASLEQVAAKMELEAAHVIRRRDFIDLFDTTPDLAGSDIDVSRFIRSGEELDVQVFWRDVPSDVKSPSPRKDEGKAPRREELCSVPAWQFRDFAKNKKNRGKIWRWNPLDRKWSLVNQDDVYPGQTFLVRSDAGGYGSDIGWNPKSKAVEPVVTPKLDEPEAMDADEESVIPGVWQSIAEHTDEVVEQLSTILSAFLLESDVKQLMLDAARWHDFGKAHPVFQKAVRASIEQEGKSPEGRPAAFAESVDVAKAPKAFWQRYERPHFRHELASALAMLQKGMDDLAVYLAAAHHGKVRLSIRSLPGEAAPDDPSRLYARGMWDGDELCEVDLGGRVTAGPARLSLECMKLGRSLDGQPSWAERMLKLRDRIGPFRLAYLEALFRAADMRASRLGEGRATEQQEVT